MTFKAIGSIAKSAVIKTKSDLLNSKLGKWLSVGALASLMACFACITAFATDPEPSGQAQITDMSSTLVTAFGSLATTLQSYIGAVLPIGIGIMGTIFAIRFGINFFMSLTHREH